MTINNTNQIRTGNKWFSIFPAYMVFIFKPDFVFISSIALNGCRSPVVSDSIFIFKVCSFSFCQHPTANFFCNFLRNMIQMRFLSFTNKLTKFIRFGESSSNYGFFQFFPTHNKTCLTGQTICTSANKLTNSFNYTKIGCLFDNTNIIPFINRSDRKPFSVIQIWCNLQNFRNSTSTIISINCHHTQRTACRNGARSIRPCQFNRNNYCCFYPYICFQFLNCFCQSGFFFIYAINKTKTCHFLKSCFIMRCNRTHQKRAYSNSIIGNL